MIAARQRSCLLLPIRRGDLAGLGPHRLLCGDSTEPADVAAALGGRAPTLMVLDPPFDVDYARFAIPPSVSVVAVFGRGRQSLRYEAGRFLGDPEWGVHELVFAGGVRGHYEETLPCCVHETVRVWRRKWWSDPFEAIDRDVMARSGVQTVKGLRPRSVQSHTGGPCITHSHGMVHGKSTRAMELLVGYAPRGSVVYDPCAGSGASLLAAAKHGRAWVGVELEPRWSRLIASRFARAFPAEPVAILPPAGVPPE